MFENFGIQLDAKVGQKVILVNVNKSFYKGRVSLKYGKFSGMFNRKIVEMLCCWCTSIIMSLLSSLPLSSSLSLSTLGLLCLVVTASSLCPASLPIVSFRASLFSDSFSVMRPSQNDGVVWLVGCSRVMYNK